MLSCSFNDLFHLDFTNMLSCYVHECGNTCLLNNLIPVVTETLFTISYPSANCIIHTIPYMLSLWHFSFPPPLCVSSPSYHLLEICFNLHRTITEPLVLWPPPWLTKWATTLVLTMTSCPADAQMTAVSWHPLVGMC